MSYELRGGVEEMAPPASRPTTEDYAPPLCERPRNLFRGFSLHHDASYLCGPQQGNHRLVRTGQVSGSSAL
jgi:hypothetical protein